MLEDKNIHKFKCKMDLTYEQYIHACYDGIIQLSRELEQILGRKKTLEIIGRAQEKHDLELVRKHLYGRKPIKNFKDFKAFMKELHESPFTSHLFTIKYLHDTATEIEFHTTECLLAKVFRDMKAADLGYVMICRPDFITTPSYCQNVHLKRTRTLMQGDDCCDTTYCFSDTSSNSETSASS